MSLVCSCSHVLVENSLSWIHSTDAARPAGSWPGALHLAQRGKQSCKTSLARSELWFMFPCELKEWKYWPSSKKKSVNWVFLDITINWKKASSLIEICSYYTSKVPLLPFYTSFKQINLWIIYSMFKSKHRLQGGSPGFLKFSWYPKILGAPWEGPQCRQEFVFVWFFYHQFMCKSTSSVHRLISRAQSKKSSNIFLSLQHCLCLDLLASLAISRGKWLGRIPPCSHLQSQKTLELISFLI